MQTDDIQMEMARSKNKDGDAERAQHRELTGEETHTPEIKTTTISEPPKGSTNTGPSWSRHAVAGSGHSTIQSWQEIPYI